MNHSRAFIILIVIAYLICGGLFAIFTPAWQTPDEPAHYNYIGQLVSGGCCPVIAAGDWDSAYLERLKSNQFDAELLGDLDEIQYEDHQPPLYYLVLAPIFGLTGGSLIVLRLVSVLIGTIIIFCSYAIGDLLLPEREWVALGAAALVAFLPQHLHILASVNNDALGWALIAITLLATVRYLKDLPVDSGWIRPLLLFILVLAIPFASTFGLVLALLVLLLIFVRIDDDLGSANSLMLGLLVGLCFMTKTTAYFMAGVVPLAILLKWWLRLRIQGAQPLQAVLDNKQVQQAGWWAGRRVMETPFLRRLAWRGVKFATPRILSRWKLPSPIQHLMLFLIPAVILGTVWWGRNLATYGVPDFLGLGAHNVVVADQPRTEDLIARVGVSDYMSQMVRDTFTSFWGQFGWMALPLSGWTWWVGAGLTMLAVSGWGIKLGERRKEKGESDTKDTSHLNYAVQNRSAWIVIVVTGVLAVLAYVYYNSEFLQFQGRYLYAGLIPFALGMALGVEAWARLLARLLSSDRPEVIYWGVTVVPFVLLASFSLYLLWRVIVPGLAP